MLQSNYLIFILFNLTVAYSVRRTVNRKILSEKMNKSFLPPILEKKLYSKIKNFGSFLISGFLDLVGIN
jgi:hypothetical protein